MNAQRTRMMCTLPRSDAHARLRRKCGGKEEQTKRAFLPAAFSASAGGRERAASCAVGEHRRQRLKSLRNNLPAFFGASTPARDV
jgi:hypothetical protein